MKDKLQRALFLIERLRAVIDETPVGSLDNGVIEDCDIKFTLVSIQTIIENELNEL